MPSSIPPPVSSASAWLLLIVTLPTHSATGRMRIWRALKALGCSALRDGAYLLPDRDELREPLAALRDDTVREGGSAWLLAVQPQSEAEVAAYQTLFDRSADHAALGLALDEAG